MTFLLVIVTLIAAAFLTALLLRRREWRRVRGRAITMESLWQAWNSLDAMNVEERSVHETLLAEVGSDDCESVHQSLLDFEASLHGEAEPMIALRKELMDSVDRRLLNTEILQLPGEVKVKLRAQSSEMLQSDSQARNY
ncbi:MAG: hypothetical protein ACRESC_08210, partial [Gammaproteobacteria bacterium]